MKYNLRSGQIEAHISVAYCSPRSYTYDWGGYSGMDLAVDEQGLWVLCGNTNYPHRLRAGKIDVETNSIPRYFDLNTLSGKQVFMMTQQLNKYNAVILRKRYECNIQLDRKKLPRDTCHRLKKKVIFIIVTHYYY